MVILDRIPICFLGGFLFRLAPRRPDVALGDLLGRSVRIAFRFTEAVDGGDDIFILQNAVAVVLKHGADLQDLDHAALLRFGQVVEEIRDDVHECADDRKQDEHKHDVVEDLIHIQNVIHIGEIQSRIICILNDLGQVGLQRCLIDAHFGIHERDDAAGCHRHDLTDKPHRREHTVDALAGHILLVVADVRIDRGR